jgi:hypothetical protein
VGDHGTLRGCWGLLEGSIPFSTEPRGFVRASGAGREVLWAFREAVGSFEGVVSLFIAGRVVKGSRGGILRESSLSFGKSVWLGGAMRHLEGSSYFGKGFLRGFIY